MAQFFPSLEEIQQWPVKPTEGEWCLLHFLEEFLKDPSYEVYFNPFLNGDRPDIVIMRQNGGVMIIEVKDWDLNLYKLDDKKHWHLKHPKNEGEKRAHIKSPISQVLNYKENLYNLHVEKLLEKSIFEPKLWAVVSCGVFFYNANKSQIQSLLVAPYKGDKGYMTFLRKGIDLIGIDDLTPQNFEKILRSHFLFVNQKSFYFEDWLYKSIKHLLLPPRYLKNLGCFLQRYNPRQKKLQTGIRMFSPKQDELIFDKQKRKEWRVKGVVGSGKTTLLAAKAIQSYKELIDKGISQPRILILTFNITLRNFIHDKIQQVGQEFAWSSFLILNYHQFIKAQLNNLGIPFQKEEDETEEEFFARYFDNYSLFEGRKHETERFDVIFIDEIQDYKRVWMEIIKNCFLCEEGEYPRGGYYLFGDVKQNIYNRGIKDKDVVTNVKGVNKLETCFRSYLKIKDLALGFQRTYFDGKYEIDKTLTAKEDSPLLGLNLQQGNLNYFYLPEGNLAESVFNIIENYIQNRLQDVAINDITVLGAELDFLRFFETYYRYKTGLKTTTMFETYELMFFEGIRDKLGIFPKILKIELIRLINRGKDNDRAKKLIANLFATYEIYSQYKDTFELRFTDMLKRHNCTLRAFLDTMSFYAEDYNKFREKVFSADYKHIRDNKKLHFWMNTGNIKISSIHSFKGWESDTVFLILQKPKKSMEEGSSFDELLYTGITRTISNLIVINLGNEEYDKNMKKLIDAYK